ncbi:MAG: DUF87 domain-containing protein [Candidatus Dormibacteraeota bacterium]|nr:DUF87 domain-containing protein [Candidatus Dormibacteraeota bacterium]
MKPIRVPLAIDAQVRIPIGPMLLPLRVLLLVAAASPLALAALQIGSLSISLRLALVAAVYVVAFSVATPSREGVWIGTWVVYRAAGGLLPAATESGRAMRARVRRVAGGVEITRLRPAPRLLEHMRALSLLSTPAGFSTTEPGVTLQARGGARAVLLVDGPEGSTTSSAYSSWCLHLVAWMLAVECPAQVFTRISRHDSHRAQLAFDAATRSSARSRLLEMERRLAGMVAEQTVGFTHYVVFSPGAAPRDGVPFLSSAVRWRGIIEPTPEEASRVLTLALRLAPGFGIQARPGDRDDIAAAIAGTIFDSPRAAVDSDGVVHCGEMQQVVLTATQLPPMVYHGALVEALTHSRVDMTAVLHLLPVDPAIARRSLDRRLALQRYAAREGNTGVDNQVAAADTTETLAALARRDLTTCRIALMLSLQDSDRGALLDSAERVGGQLQSKGFEMTIVRYPGFVPVMGLAPGGAPLGRSLVLTSSDVASCLLPALGTPFNDVRQPLVGISELTGAPAYLSVWSRANHNAVIVGSSGSGKSVTAKTLLARHVVHGATAVVIDPDSEYRRLMLAIGGRHLELGDDALNPLAAGVDVAADTAASMVLPTLSVMAGDEKGIRDGRPVRRLPDEDLAWLHGEVSAFFARWREHDGQGAPLIGDLVEFLRTDAGKSEIGARERDRCALIASRLRRFTQGDRERIFNRRSTFEVGTSPVAVGLRQLSLTYAADLTPALAVVLTSVLAALKQLKNRLIVVVDEAHRVTSDPDAGEVLGQLVRQARKYGAGVWMCSQRVDDFIGTDLGRTLAATAATKMVLGVEEAMAHLLAETFALSEEEAALVSPPVQGRGVLISGQERTVVRVLPGPALLSVAESGAPETPTERRASSAA